MSFGEALPVLKAFTTYFQLVNLAEQKEIVRVNRRRAFEAGDQPRPESVRDAVKSLRESGVTADEMRALVASLSIQLVFTAHPTEAKRRSVQEKLHRLSDYLGRLEEPLLSRSEQERLEMDVAAETEILWQTDEVRQRRLSVLDEARNILFYFGETLVPCDAAPLRRSRKGFGAVVSRRSIRHPRLSGIWVVGRRRPGRQPDDHAGTHRRGAAAAPQPGAVPLYPRRAEPERPPEPVPPLCRRLGGFRAIASLQDCRAAAAGGGRGGGPQPDGAVPPQVRVHLGAPAADAGR